MDSDLYKELSALTKSKERWEENIPYVTSLLTSESTKIKAKALWLLGEIWASENIATNTPEPYKDYLPLCNISETDTNRVVRIHCLGAIRAGSAI